jgi:cyclophilin family peptidyl-prolyl cis-trans isomerase
MKTLLAISDWLAPRRTQAEEPLRRRLEVEELEERCLLSAAPLGTISGTAFVDAASMGSMFPGAPTLPGVPVNLSGMTTDGTGVNVTAMTNGNGGFSFTNVPAGRYQVSAGPVAGLPGGSIPFMMSGASPGTAGHGVSIGQGQNVSQNVGFQGLAAGSISVRQFLSSTTAADFADLSGIPGSGFASAFNPPAQIFPFITTPISAVTVAMNSAATNINLAGHFSSPDISTSEISMNTSDGPLNVTLFDAQDPQTVANFYDYITSGQYNNSIFHRLMSGFVLQGGGTTLVTSSSGSDLQPVPIGPTVPSEFSSSNTEGTIAMALSGMPADPNSATNQFFFNLANNSASLDPQLFTVFGTLADSASQTVLNKLSSVPAGQIHNESGNTALTTANPGVDFSSVPLPGYTGTNFPTDAAASNFLVINSINILSRPDFLTYAVVGNTNQPLVTASITNEHLTLSYAANQTGTAIITIRATNQLGNSIDESFNVTVTP